MQQNHLFLAVVAALVAIGLYLSLDTSEPASWSLKTEDLTSPELALKELLTSKTQNNRPTPGLNVSPVRFRRSNGDEMVVHIREGAFTSSIILPLENWSSPKQNVLLVNSTDETESGLGGLSRFVHQGCGVQARRPSVSTLLNMGDVQFRNCNGPYRTTHGIRAVANLVIIVRENFGKEPPCHLQANGSNQLYYECVSEQLRRSLSNMFIQLQNNDLEEAIDTIVFPPIATGAGETPPEYIYNALESCLLDQLKCESCFVPNHLVLQVYRQDPNWYRLKVAIPTFLARLDQKWSKMPNHSSNTHLEQGVGVALAIYVILLLLPTESKIIQPFSRAVRSHNHLLVALALATAGLSIVTGAYKLIDALYPDKITFPINVALGFACTLSCGYVIPMIEDIKRIFDRSK